MSVSIRTRTVSDGKRYDVRYRRGGRFFPVEHAGTFKTKKEALVRAERVRLWLADGRDPKTELQYVPVVTPRLEALHAKWISGRRGIDDTTLSGLRGRQKRIDAAFGSLRPGQVTYDAVNDWVGVLVEDGLAPGTIQAYQRQLAQLLDYAGCDPNPARDKRVELPKNVRGEVEPPDADEVLAVIRAAPVKHRLAIVFLEQTAARVTAATSIDRSQLDVDGSRVLVRAVQEKTERARWVELEPWLTDLLAPLTGRLFPASRQAVFMALRNGGATWGPHQLRHRRATLWHQAGIPHAELARRLGHARPSMSLERYTHVLPLREIPVGEMVQALTYESTSVRST